jgi:hypothetical protein
MRIQRFLIELFSKGNSSSVPDIQAIFTRHSLIQCNSRVLSAVKGWSFNYECPMWNYCRHDTTTEQWVGWIKSYAFTCNCTVWFCTNALHIPIVKSVTQFLDYSEWSGAQIKWGQAPGCRIARGWSRDFGTVPFGRQHYMALFNRMSRPSNICTYVSIFCFPYFLCFFFRIPIGIGIGCNIRVGHLLGASKPRQASRAVIAGYTLSWSIAVVVVILLLSFRYYLPMAYSQER